MSGRLEGKVVVVTGGARGQGKAEVEHLAAEGAHVWIGDILDDAGAEVASSWSGPGSVVFRHLDVTRLSDWESLRDDLESAHGQIHGLVNNAGIPSRDRLPNVDVDTWRRTIDINVTGPLVGIQTLHPLMGSGASIVNVVSVAGLGGHVAAPYTASKWALRGLSKAASLEFGNQGIRVNAIFPGLIETPIMEGASPRFRDAAIKDTPLARIGQPDDIAPLIVYLISDESSYVTGAEIAIDGGMSGHVSHKGIADAISGP